MCSSSYLPFCADCLSSLTKITLSANCREHPQSISTKKKKKGESKSDMHLSILGQGRSNDDKKKSYQTQDLCKPKYTQSVRTLARIATKKNATSIFASWSIYPFRWKKNRFKCAYCEENFIECSQLRLHVGTCSIHHSIDDIYSKFREMPVINVDISEASCRFCSLPYTSVKQMTEHLSHHGLDFNPNHPEGVVPFSLDKESWKCVICLEIFNNFLKLYEHMNIHYQYYVCSICGKGYMTAGRLRKHTEVHISGTFPCNKCDRIFTMRAARDSHKASIHAKEPRYECPHCKERFVSYYDRMEHMKDAHSEREVTYSCSHCDMTFKTSAKRAGHIKSVHFPQLRDFACDYCEWKFKTNYELKRHMIRHTGEKNFRCLVCGKAFARKRVLVIHLKTHHDDPRLQGDSQLRNHPELTGLVPNDAVKM